MPAQIPVLMSNWEVENRVRCMILLMYKGFWMIRLQPMLHLSQLEYSLDRSTAHHRTTQNLQVNVHLFGPHTDRGEHAVLFLSF